jgi:ankyrin repeat protein
MVSAEPALMQLVRAIAARDTDKTSELLKASPALATASVELGAARQESSTYYLDEINHYVYAGDTALHVAAAAYQPDLVRTLLAVGADVSTKNRRGAEPLHTGRGGSGSAEARAQQALIVQLLERNGAAR